MEIAIAGAYGQVARLLARLTDDPGRGRVLLDAEAFRGEVSRDDVAAVLAAVLHEPRAARRTLYVNAGDQAVGQALAAALGR